MKKVSIKNLIIIVLILGFLYVFLSAWLMPLINRSIERKIGVKTTPVVGGSLEMQSCKENNECGGLNCWRYDNEIKSGYRPYCVEGKCRCMCYGCH